MVIKFKSYHTITAAGKMPLLVINMTILVEQRLHGSYSNTEISAGISVKVGTVRTFYTKSKGI